MKYILKSKKSGLTQSLLQYYLIYIIKACLLVYICTKYCDIVYITNNAQQQSSSEL